MVKRKSYAEIEDLVNEKDWKRHDLDFLREQAFGKWSTEKDGEGTSYPAQDKEDHGQRKKNSIFKRLIYRVDRHN